MNRASTLASVRDTSEVAVARRIATQCAESLHMSEAAVGRVALAVTELATNLVKHGDGGDIIIGSNDEVPGRIELLAIDKGRGIRNVASAMRDGFSTAGSPGTGLGAVERGASSFDIYSSPNGTAVLCRIDDDTAPQRSPLVPSADQQMQVAGVCIAYPGEEESGDAWAAVRRRSTMTVVVADGLGHGPAAAEASVRAVRIFKESPDEPLDQMIRAMHDALRSTRGAAVGIGRILLDRGSLEFVGVGNIACSVAGGNNRRMMSHNGIVGHEMRKVQTLTYPWDASSVLVAHSDGIHTNWNLDNYPGLEQRDAAIIAGVLYRDHCRRNDDATIVVAKA